MGTINGPDFSPEDVPILAIMAMLEIGLFVVLGVFFSLVLWRYPTLFPDDTEGEPTEAKDLLNSL